MADPACAQAYVEARIEIDTKTCGKCQEEKPLDEFHKRGKGKLQAKCKPCTNAAEKAIRDANPLKVREKNLKRFYGITLERYAELLAVQGGKCALSTCTATTGSTGKPLYVDHDHVTGKVRGLLCSSCNVGIGNLGDSVEALEAAIRYLKGAL